MASRQHPRLHEPIAVRGSIQTRRLGVTGLTGRQAKKNVYRSAQPDLILLRST